MQILVLPAARQEIRETFDWYEAQRAGLGARFSNALYAQLNRIVDNPLRFPLIIKDVRHARLREFPYRLFFRCDEDRVFVLACLHGRRDPMVWKNRL